MRSWKNFVEAWRSLNDVLRNLRNAELALLNRDHNLIAAHLQVAKRNVGEVKKAIKAVGESKIEPTNVLLTKNAGPV